MKILLSSFTPSDRKNSHRPHVSRGNATEWSVHRPNPATTKTLLTQEHEEEQARLLSSGFFCRI